MKKKISEKFNLKKIEQLNNITFNTNKLILFVFLINIICYFFFITGEILHNHAPRLSWQTGMGQITAGRWFHYFINKFNYEADLPLISSVFSIIINIFNCLIIFKIFDFENNKFNSFLLVLFFTLFPINLVYFYYSWITLTMIVSILFACSGVYFFRENKFILSIISFVFCLSSYQPNFSIGITLSLCFILYEITKSKNENLFSFLIKRLLNLSIIFIASAAIYKLSVLILGFEKSLRKNSINRLEIIIEKFPSFIKESLNQFTYTQPEFLFLIKYLLLFFLIFSFLFVFYSFRNNIKKSFILLILTVLIVFSSKAMFLFGTPNNFLNYRYSGNLVIIYLFSFIIFFKYSSLKLLNVFAIILLIFLNLKFAQADLYRQKILLYYQKQELHVANRILQRIEDLDNLELDKTYNLVRIGRYSNNRIQSFKSKGINYDRAGDTHMDFTEIFAVWTGAAIFKHLGSKIKFKHNSYDPEFQKKIEKARKEFSHLEPWPHKESVFLIDDTIYIKMQ